MRIALILFFIFGFSFAYGKVNGPYCAGNLKLAKDLDPKNVNTLLNRGAGHEYDFDGFRWGANEQARNMAMNNPVLQKHGFDFNSPNRTPYVCRLHFANGKNCGWEVRNENGDWGRLRIDYDPTTVPPKFAHYNLEFVKNGVTYKYAFKFDCNGAPCSVEEMEKFRQQMFP